MAAEIGADSWAMLNFEQLPRNASAARQVEALKADQTWQRLKWEETSRAIDELIADIESTSNDKANKKIKIGFLNAEEECSS